MINLLRSKYSHQYNCVEQQRKTKIHITNDDDNSCFLRKQNKHAKLLNINLLKILHYIQ